MSLNISFKLIKEHKVAFKNKYPGVPLFTYVDENTYPLLMEGQNFKIEAEFSFERATSLILDLIASGFSLDAKQEGNKWTITGILSKQHENQP